MPAHFSPAEIQTIARWLDDRDMDYSLCAWTGQIILADEDDPITLANGDMVTRDAFDDEGSYCDHCQENFHREKVDYYSSVGLDLCESCVSDHYNTCDHCDEIYAAGSQCSCGNSHVHSASASPLSRLAGFRRGSTEKPLPDKKTLWLGVELEVVARSQHLADGLLPTLDAVEDFAILKEDGSLPSYGFEICTVPGTLAWHREAWGKFFKNAAPELLSYHAPGRCCGMHIHFSRDAVTPLQAGKMMVFVSNPTNSTFLKAIAGRWGNSYARARDKTFKDGRFESGYHHHFDALGYSARTGETLEFRIFRGTVNPDGFYKNMEFTVALVEFCKDSSVKKLGYTDFLEWFAQPENRTRFPALDNFLHRKEYLQIKRPRLAQAA